MPVYHVHIAASREEPMPPVAELTTIEAKDPHDALAKLRQEKFVLRPDLETVWLKVVVGYWPNGETRHVLSTEVPVERVIDLN